MAAAERVALQLPPRRAAKDAFKKRTILRAEGGQLQAPVGPLPLRSASISVVSGSTTHDISYRLSAADQSVMAQCPRDVFVFVSQAAFLASGST